MSWVNLSDIFCTKEEYNELKDAWDSISQDYIVSQGTSGNWTYRKWNSGIAECWCTTSQNFTSEGLYTSNLYFFDGTAKSYPFSFAAIPACFTWKTTHSASGAISTGSAGTISATPKPRILTSNTASSYTETLCFFAIGRWK